MKRTFLAITLALVTLMASAQTALKKVYDETIDPMAQIDNALATAKASDTNKFVICQVGGNWCPWCLRFADFISKDSDITKVVNENFIYLHVNYNPRKSGGEEQTKAAAALMKRLGNPQRFGFPVFVVLDQNGNALHIQDSSFLEVGQGYNKEKILRFFNDWTPKAIGETSATVLATEASDNEVINTIMARRSVRKYLDKPVEHEKLELLAKCGINAPNGMNSQRWAVRVVESKDWIDGTTAIFKKANPDMVSRDANFKKIRASEGNESSLSNCRTQPNLSNMFRNAPNIICVATPNGESSLDAGMLGENIMLAAQSLDLGTCCLGGPVRFLNSNADCKPYLDKLNLPDGYQISFIIAVGYPDEQPEAKPRDTGKIEYIK